MDMRTSRNLGQAQKAQQTLDSIVVDQKELDKLSQEALDFFFCVLSQNNIKETLLDLDEKTDAIGFGLAVMRPEHVLDEPTGVSAIHVFVKCFMLSSYHSIILIFIKCRK